MDTTSVIERHLELRKDGSLEDDIAQNYHPDVVLLTGTGVYRGWEGVRECADDLGHLLGDDPVVQTETLLVDGPHAFVEWSVWESGREVSDGSDSFRVEDGKIVLQTIHYTVNPVS